MTNNAKSHKRKLSKSNKMLDLLKKYFPHSIELIGNSREFEKNVDSFEKRYENLKTKLANEGDSISEIHWIYEWIVSAENGDKKAAFLHFIDSVFKNIQSTITAGLRSKLKTIVSNIFTAFDIEVYLENNPTYLTFIAELLVLDDILNSTEHYKLTGSEVQMPNEKKTDFVLLDIQKGRRMLLDVFSLNSFKLGKINFDQGLTDFFRDRFNQKLETKTKGLGETESGTALLIDGETVDFRIAPVLWNELSALWSLRQTPIKVEGAYVNVRSLSILYVFLDDGGEYAFKFTTLSNAFTHP